MPTLYRLTLVLTLLCYPIAQAKSSDFLGVVQYLNKYHEEIKNKDLFHVSGVFQRCAGVFGAYGKYLPTDMRDMKLKFVNLSVESMKKSINYLNMTKQNKPELNLKQVDTAVRYFTDVYYKSLEIDQLNTGTIMKGNSATDMKMCMGLFK
jgi:hypothetical protein